MIIKPRAGAKVGSHPVSQGIVWAALPGIDFPYEVINNGAITLVNAANANITTETSLGLALFSGSTTSGGGYYPWSDALLSITKDFTVIVWADITVMADYGKLWCTPYNAGAWTTPYGNLSFEKLSSTTAATISYASSGPTINSIDSDTGFLDTTSGMSQYVVVKSGTSVTFYKNGKKHGAGKTITNNNVSWQKNPISIFQRNPASQGEGITGTCPQSLVYNRALTSDEVALLSAFPFIWTDQYDIYLPYVASTASGDMVATIDGTSSSSAVLTGIGNAIASISGTGALTAILSGIGNLTGQANGVGASTISLSGLGIIISTAAGTASISASISGLGSLVITVSGTGGLSAGLGGLGNLSTTIGGTGSVSAALGPIAEIASIMGGQASTSFVLSGLGNLSMNVSGASGLSASLAGLGNLRTDLIGTGGLSAVLGGLGSLSLTVSGTGAISAALEGLGTPIGGEPSQAPYQVFITSALTHKALFTANQSGPHRINHGSGR